MVDMPKVSIDTDMTDSFCFACGQNNPIGLKLEFRRHGEDGVIAECTPGRHYQGWRGILHGGILACMLDEATSHAAHHAGAACVTATLTVRFRQSVMVEEPLVITATITRQTRKLIESHARVALTDGTVVAEGAARQYIVGPPAKRSGGSGGGRSDD